MPSQSGGDGQGADNDRMDCVARLTNSMEPNPAREANSHSARQDITRFYGTQRFYHHVHKSLPLSDPYPEPDAASSHRFILPLFLRSILILSSHLHQGLPSGLFPSRHASLISSIRITYPVHLILPHSITLTIFSEVYKL